MKGKYSFERNPIRVLPDGRSARVFPFHVSLEGKEDRVLCRDSEDYDVFVKIIVICSRRKNVILLVYTVVSNHGHFVVLCVDKTTADGVGDEVKRMYSMYFRRKYGDSGVMRRLDVDSQWLDSDWYLKNAIAYDMRNALDNGACNVHEYKWTSYRAYFASSDPERNPLARKVSSLSKAERRSIMRTNDDLKGVKWLIDSGGELIPGSVCYHEYVEQAFENSPAIFLQKIGLVNMAEMSERLVNSPRTFKKDEEVFRAVSDICRRWFSCEVHDLPFEKKCRLIPYYFRSNRTSVPQLARVFELPKETVSEILRRNQL